jgi:ribonuclease HI
MAKRFEGQPAVNEAEATGVLEALNWMHNIHITACCIETDSLQVAQAIGSKSKNNLEFGVIIEACRRILVLNQNCKVSYIRRQANRVAHDLAQATRFTASSQIYNHCPPCIESTIMNEMH